MFDRAPSNPRHLFDAGTDASRTHTSRHTAPVAQRLVSPRARHQATTTKMSGTEPWRRAPRQADIRGRATAAARARVARVGARIPRPPSWLPYNATSRAHSAAPTNDALTPLAHINHQCLVTAPHTHMADAHQEAAEMEAAIEWEDVEYKISTEAAPRAASRKLRARLGLAPRASSQPQPQSSSALSDDVVSIEMSSDSDSTAASSSAAPTPSKERTLIHRTSGFMPRAKFIAIMGSSGAGKTTFLNVLSGQLKKDWKSECSGVIRVNGRRLTSQVFQFVSLSLSSSRPLSRPLSLPSFIRLIAVCDAMW